MKGRPAPPITGDYFISLSLTGGTEKSTNIYIRSTQPDYELFDF